MSEDSEVTRMGEPQEDSLRVAMPDETRLADREALRELRALYSHYWDDGDATRFIALFTEDGTLQAATAGFVRGRHQLRRMVETSMARLGFTVHFTTDEVTEFTGPDTARGLCRFAVHTGRSPNGQGAGTYVDEYRKTADGWRFVSRLQRFFYMGETNVVWPATPPLVDYDYSG